MQKYYSDSQELVGLFEEIPGPERWLFMETITNAC